MQINKNGFTLIELSLVLIIIGVLAGSIFWSYKSFQESVELVEDDKRLESLKISIQNYYHNYKKLPCPALTNSLSTDSNFGLAAIDCVSSCPSGLICDATIATGLVPFKTLNIPSLLAQDNNSMNISYTVDRKFTINKCSGKGGQIILTKNGNTISNGAIFTIVNNGQDLSGSYPFGGGARNACNLSLSDAENCNDNRIFTQQNIVMESGANYFDDIIKYHTNTNASCPNNLSDCTFWLDASGNTCELILSNPAASQNVDQWLDKSVNNFVANQSSAGLMPMLVDDSTLTINGNTYLSYGSNLLSINNPSILPNTNFSLSVVFQTTNTDGAIAGAASGNSFSSTSDRVLGLRTINGKGGLVAFTMQSAPMLYTTDSYNDGLVHLATVIVDSVNGTSIYVDGYRKASNIITSTTFTNATNFNIGGTTDQGWQSYYGNLMEIVIVSKSLSDIERISFEKELASKWSINY